jgi:hypothetical protein
MAMEDQFARERLQKWLNDIVSTEPEEVDCVALEDMLEQLVAIGASGQDVREVLPRIALHLDHCPECGEWYETIVALAREDE